MMQQGVMKEKGKKGSNRFALNMPEVRLLQDHPITSKEQDFELHKGVPDSNRTSIGAQHQRKYARTNLA